jgi:hypothetical protein
LTGPTYNKPATPGIHLSVDNTISIYHVIGADDTFIGAARDVFALLREAQTRFPNRPRVIYLDIEGHRGVRAGFDADFFEFQQEFLILSLGPFFTAIDAPLLSVINPDPQRNDVPDVLQVSSDDSDTET